MKHLTAPFVALLCALPLTACGDSDAATRKASKEAEYTTKLQAYYPGIANKTEARKFADDLCTEIRKAGSFEDFFHTISMGVAFSDKTDDPETYANFVNIGRAMQVAMPWRCPEFYDDAKAYIASKSGG